MVNIEEIMKDRGPRYLTFRQNFYVCNRDIPTGVTALPRMTIILVVGGTTTKIIGVLDKG
jgi:hypothetical protein